MAEHKSIPIKRIVYVVILGNIYISLRPDILAIAKIKKYK